MSWRVIAAVMVAVFAIAVGQAALVGPLTQVGNDLNETGDYSDNGFFDGNAIIGSIVGDWLNMGLVAIFGVMTWGFWRVVRKELTRGGRL